MPLMLVTGPTAEPVTLDDIQTFCGVIDDTDAVTLQSLVAAARHRIERITGRQLNTATYDDARSCVADVDAIMLRRPPLADVVSVTYIDVNGATQTWGSSNYQVEAPVGPSAGFGRLFPAYGQSWPSIRQETANAFVVRYTAGYGSTADDVPGDLQQAVRLMVRGWFDGEPSLVAAGEALALPYKVFA